MRNSFDNINEIASRFQSSLFYEVRKAGIWQGVDAFKDYNMRVLRNVDFEYNIPYSIEKLQLQTEADQPWSETHFQERISGMPLNPGESYKIWPYNQFKEDNDPYMHGKKFSHTYMERFWPKFVSTEDNSDSMLSGSYNQGIRYRLGDLNDVLKQLRDNPLTRQAYLPIFFPEDTGATQGQRVPCTLGYLFEIDNNSLDITYYIRSCDIFRHFRNDVYLASRLAQYMASQLESIQPGTLYMKIANLHLFENDLYAYKKKEGNYEY